MIRRIILLVAALALVATLPTAADAGPVIGAIGAIFGGFSGSALFGTLARLGLGLGLSYLFRKRPAPEASAPQQPIGLSSALTYDGVAPRAFPIGETAVTSTLVYRNSYGDDGGTPNAFYVEVHALADIPITALTGLIVDGIARAYDPNATAVQRGRPIAAFTTPSRANLWVIFHDGTQNAADAYLTAKFGADPKRPWTSDYIGTGVAYMIVTARWSPLIFKNYPRVQAVVRGIPEYDRRHDSTAGGSGTQRYASPATWLYTANPIVHIQNILTGIKYAGVKVWGGQTIGFSQIPFDSSAAAASECGNEVAAVGGTEFQYTANGEVRFDMQPIDVIDELLKACNGHMAENGGLYKFLVGAPGPAVFSFTDGNVLSSEPQTFRPFPGLDETVNGVTANYVSPGEGWGLKAAPPLYDSALETADGGRRLERHVDYGFVTSGSQTQRLMRAQRDTDRAFRVHQLPMPPEAYLLEPLDTVAFDSDRNGYDAKGFTLQAADDLPNLNQALTIKEIDPNAYNWTPADDETPVIDFPRLPVGATPQPATDWFVAGYTIPSGGSPARAGLIFGWDATLDDVDGVRIQVRLASDLTVVLDREFGEETFLAGAVIVSQNLFPATDYQVRFEYRTASPRPMQWSDETEGSWRAVTTPDIRISQGELDNALKAKIDWLIQQLPAKLLILDDALNQLAGSVNGQVTVIREQMGQINIGAGARFNQNKATIEQALVAIADINSAFAAYVLQANAQFATQQGLFSAGGLFQVLAGANVNGAVATIDLQAKAGVNGVWTTAAIQLAAFVDSVLGSYSVVKVAADRFLIGNDAAFEVVAGITKIKIANIPLLTAAVIAAGAITADKIAAGAIVAGKIAADAIAAVNIQANAIVADKISVREIDASKIKIGGVTFTELAANASSAFDHGTTGSKLFGPNARTPDLANFTFDKGSFVAIVDFDVLVAGSDNAVFTVCLSRGGVESVIGTLKAPASGVPTTAVFSQTFAASPAPVGGGGTIAVALYLRISGNNGSSYINAGADLNVAYFRR